jgi:hypothetical protein
MANIIQNHETDIEKSVIDDTTEKVVKKIAADIFEAVISVNDVKNIVDDLCAKLYAHLTAESFMTDRLELTDKQKHALKDVLYDKANVAHHEYLAKIDQDKRRADTAKIIQTRLEALSEKLMSELAQTINRGAIINSIAIKADSKSEKFDVIELQKTKDAGDITIPTRCVLISTNCVDLIKSALEIDPRGKQTADALVAPEPIAKGAKQ